MSISVQHIVKNYGVQKALDDVSFEIKTGEIVGLLGPNGAGKTTLMKILTCFLPPTSGEAFVCNHSVIEHSLEVRKKIGYLAENNPLYTEMYVKEFLLFVAGLHKLGKNKNKRVQQMIEITGLEAEQHKKIGELSKGYRQRVGLAQALIHNPEVLILDEPTSGLDPNQILEIRDLIKKIGKEKTVMLSTHIMQEVEAVCNRVIIINKGIIVADEKTTQLHDLLGKKNTVIVEFASYVSAEMLKKISGVKNIKHKKDFTWEIHPEKPEEDIRERIFLFAAKNNLTILSLKRQESSMEEIFHQLTTKEKNFS